jgi:hypothetical protein
MIAGNARRGGVLVCLLTSHPPAASVAIHSSVRACGSTVHCFSSRVVGSRRRVVAQYTASLEWIGLAAGMRPSLLKRRIEGFAQPWDLVLGAGREGWPGAADDKPAKRLALGPSPALDGRRLHAVRGLEEKASEC